VLLVDDERDTVMLRFNWKQTIRWTVFISIVTFFLACAFSVVSTNILDGATIIVGVVVVLAIILVGIVFDMMGLASASASEEPFHAMASERVRGSRQAIAIVRHADRFSNFCNDVIGDICGIIGGAASTMVIVQLLDRTMQDASPLATATTVAFSGIVSALMVGGKAIGKSLAISHAVPIVLWMGKFFYVLERRLGIRIWHRKRSTGKRGTKRASRSTTTPD
jgi:CBS domain containing-hemolysin-like protein